MKAIVDSVWNASPEQVNTFLTHVVLAAAIATVLAAIVAWRLYVKVFRDGGR
jgi:NADH:ubiquinone oxidoreductase subunit 5 (subunit L)/multisubunit Na+/H+ antiporter MnhA subunit